MSNARTAVLIAALVVLAAGVAVSLPRNPALGMNAIDSVEIGPEDTAEELWARALWQSVPDETYDEADMERLFVAAIERSGNPAPILVSFGDAASGPGAASEILASVSENTTATEVEGLADELADFVANGSDESTALYAAAAKVDPSCLVAWERLATHGDERPRKTAIDELLVRDPDNALACYLRAGLEFERGYDELGLHWIRKGTSRGTLRLSPTPRPRRFRLCYPESDFFVEVGVAGRLATPAAIETFFAQLDERWSFADPGRKALRDVIPHVLHTAETHADAGRLDDARRWLDALEGIGLMMQHVEPSEPLVMLNGSLALAVVVEQTEQTFGPDQRTRRLREQLDVFLADARRANNVVRRRSKHLARQMLLGQWDPHRLERRLYRRALERSSLPTPQGYSADSSRFRPTNQ